MAPDLRSQLLFTLAVAAALGIAGVAAADTVDLAPSRDNTLIETPVGNSNGAGDGIYVGRVGSIGGGTRRRGLVAFDVSAIPSGSTINSATLTLEMAQTNDVTPRTITLHRVSADWGEAGSLGSGSGAAALPGDATWLFRFFNTDSWTAAGGDFAVAASATQTVGDIGSYTWTDAGLAADVQSWVDDASSNFGWLVLGDDPVATTARKFYSREGFTPPKLTVDYTPHATDVPPSTPDAVRFAAPWPSPASGRVTLSYTLPVPSRVSLSIHDAMGRVVRRLEVGDIEPAGRRDVSWDGRTDSGARAATGLYLARLVVGERAYQRRIPLVH